MPATFENLTQDVDLVSTRYGFQISSERPGAALGLQGLEQACAGLMASEHFGNKDVFVTDALKSARSALERAYSRLPASLGIDPAEEVQKLTASVQANLDRLKPAQGREVK